MTLFEQYRPRMGRDYYEVLGVPLDASADEIRAAYRDLSKRVHPDVGGNAALFGLIQDAYETLFDAGRRAEYDRQRQSSARDERQQRPEPVFVFVERRTRWRHRVAIAAAVLIGIGAVAAAVETRRTEDVVPIAADSQDDPMPTSAVVQPPTTEPASVYEPPVVDEPLVSGDTTCSPAATIAEAVRQCPGLAVYNVNAGGVTSNGVWATAWVDNTATAEGGVFLLEFFRGSWQVVDYGPYLACPPLGMTTEEELELGDPFQCE